MTIAAGTVIKFKNPDPTWGTDLGSIVRLMGVAGSQWYIVSVNGQEKAYKDTEFTPMDKALGLIEAGERLSALREILIARHAEMLTEVGHYAAHAIAEVLFAADFGHWPTNADAKRFAQYEDVLISVVRGARDGNMGLEAYAAEMQAYAEASQEHESAQFPETEAEQAYAEYMLDVHGEDVR